MRPTRPHSAAYGLMAMLAAAIPFGGIPCVMAAERAGADSSSQETSQHKEDSMIAPPTTRHELLLNLKQAFDSGLMLDRSFYTRENLSQRFAGQVNFYEWKADPSVLIGKIFYESGRREKMRPDNLVNTVIDFSLERKDGRGRASWSLNLKQFVTYSQVAELFGDSWREIHALRTGAPPPFSSRHMGEKVIAYDVGQEDKVVVMFTGDGDVFSITFEAWER